VQRRVYVSTHENGNIHLKVQNPAMSANLTLDSQKFYLSSIWSLFESELWLDFHLEIYFIDLETDLEHNGCYIEGKCKLDNGPHV
jgi:hypothetical protein